MTHKHGRSGFAYVIGKRSQRAVRAAHRVSALQQEAGDGGETASPDADKMDVCHVVSSL